VEEVDSPCLSGFDHSFLTYLRYLFSLIDLSRTSFLGSFFLECVVSFSRSSLFLGLALILLL